MQIQPIFYIFAHAIAKPLAIIFERLWWLGEIPYDWSFQKQKCQSEELQVSQTHHLHQMTYEEMLRELTEIEIRLRDILVLLQLPNGKL